MYTAKHMKWWGWGDEEAGFNSSAHPGLWPYAKAVLGVEGENRSKPLGCARQFVMTVSWLSCA
jgi:hypothetical protein